jgi:hypothetical protein
MVAYVVNASGLANDPTKYTPNGLPTNADTLTIGAFTLTIPSGYTLDVGAITMTGTGVGARSQITINGGGKLKQNSLMTLNAYNRIHWSGGGIAEWEVLNNQAITHTAQSGSNLNNYISNDGATTLKLYGPVGTTTAISSNGILDINSTLPDASLIVTGISFKFGGGFYAGMHLRMRNVLFLACGQVGTVRYIEPSNDCIIDNVEFRGGIQAASVNITLFNLEKSNGNAVTGTQYIDNLLISAEIPSNLFTPSGYTTTTLSGLVANGNKDSINYSITDTEDGDVVYVPAAATMVVATNGIITNTTSTAVRFYVKHTSRNVITPYDLTFDGLFKPNNCSVMVARFEAVSSNIDVRSIKFRKCTPLNTSTPSGTWKKIFSDCFSNFGDVGSTPLLSPYIVTMANNPHTMAGSLRDFQNGVIDINSPSYTGDGSDDFPVPDTTNCFVKNTLIIDNYGGTRLNALGVATRSGVYTLDHCTVVVSVRSTSRNYGLLVRNENSGTFSAGATTTVKNTVCSVINNATNSFDVRVFNIETPGNDQIDYLDYNTYSFVGVTPATVYYQVTSGTKGAIGSQTGWGMNDQMNVDPQFVDSTRNFFKFINNNQAGLTDAQKIDWFLQSQNGFDPVTNTFDPAKKRTSINFDTLTTYVKAGYVVQNPLLNNSGSDGVTRGAFAYQALSMGAGFTAVISSKLLSSSNLTTIALTTRS